MSGTVLLMKDEHDLLLSQARERGRLTDELATAQKRIGELLEVIAKLSKTLPYADEAEQSRDQVRVLIAEVGTLKFALTMARKETADIKEELESRRGQRTEMRLRHHDEMTALRAEIEALKDNRGKLVTGSTIISEPGDAITISKIHLSEAAQAGLRGEHNLDLLIQHYEDKKGYEDLFKELAEWNASDEVQGSFMYADVHGFTVTEEFSKKAGAMWDRVREIAKKAK